MTTQVLRLVIYDGVCKLCDGTVKFLIARDPNVIFHFAALQSEAAQPFLRTHGISEEEALKSIVFIDDGVAYRKSAAALMIASYLPAPWKYMYSFFYCTPRCLRDTVYDMVASNRYNIFGKKTPEEEEVCLMPTKDVMARFLDAKEMMKPTKAKSASSGSANNSSASNSASSSSSSSAASSTTTSASPPSLGTGTPKKGQDKKID